MTPEDRARLLDAFGELTELEPAERAARLAELRRQRPDLAGELERLLAADALDGPFDRLQGEVAAEIDRSLLAYEQAAPRTVGSWTLVEPIGEGGMGEVWKAERTQGGFAQLAALKLVRFGMASDSIVQRFLLERQVLARLNHPAIARLYDGGLAADGRPWFAMEYVDGVPITEFAHGRSLEEILRLFLEVAEAVDFAHRQLVVHRDIKPSNLLVTVAGEPKLLDFGLAKLLEPDLDPGLTRTELRALTPAYAAPEQILGEPITTATDVYALGVVLYQLLTERLPHRREARSEALLADAVSRETVERPSAAVRRDAAESKRDRRLSRRLAGDLDTIVLQALRREPERRYPSAAAFADDIRRFLEGRPVSARADTLTYRASKFLRRHYVGVGATALVLVALVTGLIGTAWQAQRAQRQAARAERVQAFLVGLFQAADPDKSRGAKITAQELLAEGSLQLESGLEQEPEVRAEMLDTVAQIEHRLGLFEASEKHARTALELRRRGLDAGAPDPVDAARARLTLAEALDGRGEMAGAAEELERALGVLERSLGPDADDVARARSGQLLAFMDRGDGAGGLVIAQQLLERQRHLRGDSHPDTAVALYEVGQMLELSDRFAEAEAVYTEGLAMLDQTPGPGDARTETVRMALAEVVGYRGARAEAVELFRQSIAGFIRTRGEAHVMVAQARVKMALVLINDGQYAEADRALTQAYATFDKLGHFDAASCVRMQGNSAFAQGRYGEAVEHYRAAFERFGRQVGSRHQLTLVSQANLGGAQVRLGALAEGRATLDQAVAGLIEAGGVESDTLRQPLQLLGEAQRRLGEPETALATHRRQLAIAEKTVGAEHIGASNAHREIALDLEAMGGEHLAEASRAIERAVQIRTAENPNQVRVADWLLEAARMARTAGDREAERAATERSAAVRAALAKPATK